MVSDERRRILRSAGRFCGEAERSRYLNLLSKRDSVAQAREEERQEAQPEKVQQEVRLVHDEEETAVSADPNRVQIWNMGRSAALGAHPKEARQRLRTSLEPGIYLATSTFRNLKILHRLGSCYLIPGVDYQHFLYLDTLIPPKSEYEQICKLCARTRTAAVKGSSCSETTSSSESESGGSGGGSNP